SLWAISSAGERFWRHGDGPPSIRTRQPSLPEGLSNLIRDIYRRARSISVSLEPTCRHLEHIGDGLRRHEALAVCVLGALWVGTDRFGGADNLPTLDPDDIEAEAHA